MATNQKYNTGSSIVSITGGRYNTGSSIVNIKYGRYNTGSSLTYINFTPQVVETPTAQLYDNGDFSFQMNSRVDATKTLKNSYTGWMNTGYTNATSSSPAPWSSQRLNVKNVYFLDPISSNNTAFWGWGWNNMTKFNYYNLNTEAIVNMACMFDNCISWVNTGDDDPIIRVGKKTTNMYWSFANCGNLQAIPTSGPNVTTMRYAFYECKNLYGTSVIGTNVTNAEFAYFNCRKISTAGAIGPKVKNMDSTFYYCCNMSGSPVVGPNTTSLRRTYAHCYKLNGNPVTGDSVTNMAQTYYYCYNLTGTPVCGMNVTDFSECYYNCQKVNGTARVQNKVTNMYRSFWNCRNVSSIIIYSNNVTNLVNCIGIRNGVNNCPKITLHTAFGTNTWNRLIYNNTLSIIGANITWATHNSNSYQKYNAAYNIYLYGATDVPSNATHAYLSTDASTLGFYDPDRYGPASYSKIFTNVGASAYANAASVPWYSNMSTIISTDFLNTASPSSMNYWFQNAVNLSAVYYGMINTGAVQYMVNTFYNCSKLKIVPFAGLNTISMSRAYYNCRNIYGAAACGPQTTNLYYAYYYCSNLATPSCGQSVTNLSGAYYYCTNMTGTPVSGFAVTNMALAYRECRNATIDISNIVMIWWNTQNMYYTFYNAGRLASSSGHYYDLSFAPNVTNMYYCFGGRNTSKALRIKAPSVGTSTWNNLLLANTYGLSAITWSYSNSSTQNYAYNATYNIYITSIRGQLV